MEYGSPQEHGPANALPNEDVRQTSRQFKGIRLREWGKWISEIRMPKSREKIYLGSYNTPEQAARAFDAAMYCLRGPNAKFNFPDSVPIRVVAAKYALNELPSTSCSLHHSIGNNSEVEPSQSSMVTQMGLSSDEQQKSEEFAFWQSLFARSDPDGFLNLEKIPSVDEEMPLGLIPNSQEEEEVAISIDAAGGAGLWNFEDV